MWHVSEVHAGLACNCPQCGATLAARRGAERGHHFAHEAGAQGCEGAQGTMLRKLARQLVSGGRPLWLPSVIATHAGRTRVVAPQTAFRPEKVTVEEWLGGPRPDLVLWAGGRALLVEIATAGSGGAARAEDVRRRQLAAVEIDASAIPAIGHRLAIEDLLLQRAPRSWLYNPKHESALAGLRADAEAGAARRRGPPAGG
jgi:hypothetical protein